MLNFFRRWLGRKDDSVVHQLLQEDIDKAVASVPDTLSGMNITRCCPMAQALTRIYGEPARVGHYSFSLLSSSKVRYFTGVNHVTTAERGKWHNIEPCSFTVHNEFPNELK